MRMTAALANALYRPTPRFLAYQPKTVGPELFMVVLSRAILGDRGTRSFDPNSRQLNTAMATS